jgi:hypothetical protein
VYSVASTNGGFRDSNPVLHGVPLLVISRQQVLLRAVRALDRAFVVKVGPAVVRKFLKRRGQDSPLQERKREGRIPRRDPRRPFFCDNI